MEKPPTQNAKSELGKAVFVGAVGAIPIAGPVAAEVLEHVFGLGYGKRMQTWQETVVVTINAMGSKLDGLADDPVLLDAVVNATRAAMATHQEEKLEALRNGVFNSVGENTFSG